MLKLLDGCFYLVSHRKWKIHLSQMTFAVDVLMLLYDYESFACHEHHHLNFPPFRLQKTTTRPSTTTTTIPHRPNMNLGVKIEIAAATSRKIAVVAIKSARKIRRAITRQAAQVPRDQRAESFHRSARKTGIILQGWTSWQREHSGKIIQVTFVSFYPRNRLTQHQQNVYSSH